VEQLAQRSNPTFWSGVGEIDVCHLPDTEHVLAELQRGLERQRRDDRCVYILAPGRLRDGKLEELEDEVIIWVE
jgi:hypothetical protein